MMTLGVLWAMFAPLSLLIAVLALVWLLRRLGVRFAGLIATVAVLAPVAFIQWRDRSEFQTLCASLGEPTVVERGQADGVLLTSPTAASFGARYVLEDGFDWIERSEGKGFVRVAADGKGGLKQDPIAAPSARYQVIETFETQAGGVAVSRIQVVERESGKVLAHAADAVFGGGMLRWALGAYGVTSCRAVVQDREAFNRFYRLARDTLRPPGATQEAPKAPNAAN